MKRSALEALIGSIAFNLGQWLLVIALSRWADLGTVGDFAWALAAATPAFLLGNLGLRTVALTDPEIRERFADYVGLRLVLTALAAVAVVGIGALFGHLGPVLLIVTGAKALDALGEIVYAWFQHDNNFTPVATSQVVNGVLTPALVIGAMLLGISTKSALAASVIASLLAVLVLARSAARAGLRLGPEFGRTAQPRTWWSLVRTAAPAGIASALTSFLANLPRYALESEDGREALAVFAAVSYVQIAGLTVIGAVATVLLPRLVQVRDTAGSDRVTPLAIRWALACLVLTPLGAGVAWLLGEPVLRLLYHREEFVEVPLLVWLVVALGVAAAGWMVDIGLAALRRFRAQLWATVITLVPMVPLTWWLVGTQGLVGAGIAAAAAAAVQGVVRAGFLFSAGTTSTGSVGTA